MGLKQGSEGIEETYSLARDISVLMDSSLSSSSVSQP